MERYDSLLALDLDKDALARVEALVEAVVHDIDKCVKPSNDLCPSSSSPSSSVRELTERERADRRTELDGSQDRPLQLEREAVAQQGGLFALALDG